MFDGYISEAHANQTMEGLNFHDIKRPKTLEEKIKNYELYRNDHKGYGGGKPTYPALIDDVKNTWKRNRTYQSYYTSIWVIGKDGKFVYTVWFAHPTYPQGDPKCYINLEKTLKELYPTPIFDFSVNQSWGKTISYHCNEKRISMKLPEKDTYTFLLYSLQGSCISNQTSHGTDTYNLMTTNAPGKYIMKIISNTKSYTLPILVQ